MGRKFRPFASNTACWNGKFDPSTFKGPIDLEIGAGVGLHPITYAKENPNRNLVAIEKTKEKFDKFKRRLERHPDLKNLMAIRANAIQWALEFAPENTFSRIFILYPNPFPVKKRFHRTLAFGELVKSLRPQGELFIASNIQDYVREAIKEISPSTGLYLKKVGLVTKGRTHFEIKYLERGENCFEAKFVKH